MGADHVAAGGAVLEEGADGLRMQARNVITFQESVHDELPVTGDFVRLAAKQDLIAHAERVEILPDLFRQREIGWAILRAEPDQATGLPAGQFDKAVVAL